MNPDNDHRDLRFSDFLKLGDPVERDEPAPALAEIICEGCLPGEQIAVLDLFGGIPLPPPPTPVTGPLREVFVPMPKWYTEMMSETEEKK